MSGKADIPLGLYVHMPWCVRKCPYCDFNSHQLKSARPDESYIDALLNDLSREAGAVLERRVDSIFFGGGTPSLFPPEEIARFLKGARERVSIASDAEVTLEANPGAIEHGAFGGYREAGVNRISLGAQSFDAESLKELGRIHAPDDTHRAVESLKAAGIENFNLDLMYALPSQSAELALKDIETASALTPTHISYYHLTLEPGTVFHARPPKALPDEDLAFEIQEQGQQVLASHGYGQYEVSAYATDGARCRHNLNYWLFGDYLGIGAGAHGKLSSSLPHGVLRTVKSKQPREYQAQAVGSTDAVLGERKRVASSELPFEFMLNALRLNEGFAPACFEERTGLKLEVIEGPLKRAIGSGLMEFEQDKWRPTALGRRFLNDLQAIFLV